MRVLHLIDHLGPGGAQSALLDLVDARGADVEVVVASLSSRVLPSAAARLAASGARLERLDLSKKDVRAPFVLRRFLVAAAPDVLHMHLEISTHVGAAVALTLPRPRPVLVTHVDNDPRHAYTWPHRLAGRLLRRGSDAHVVSGASIAEALRATFGPVRRLEIIPHGIEVARFTERRTTAAMAALRGGADLVIGAIGRLVPPKGLDVLLDAMPRIRGAVAGVRLLIVGDGPQRAELEARAARLALDDVVTFAGYRHDVETTCAAMDLFVFPSRPRYEGQGLVLAEAMAMGVPVVATRVSGIVDVVEDGRTGILVPPEDPAALADAVCRLLRDEALRRALATRARQTVVTRYSRETMTARTEALYRDLLAAMRGQSPVVATRRA